MAYLIITEGVEDFPDNQCSECGVKFNLSWHRNGYTERIEYCPFCGEQFDESDHTSD